MLTAVSTNAFLSQSLRTGPQLFNTAIAKTVGCACGLFQRCAIFFRFGFISVCYDRYLTLTGKSAVASTRVIFFGTRGEEHQRT